MSKNKQINIKDENGLTILNREVLKNEPLKIFIPTAFDLISQGAKNSLKNYTEFFKSKNFPKEVKKSVVQKNDIVSFFRLQYKSSLSLEETLGEALSDGDIFNIEEVQKFLLSKFLEENNSSTIWPRVCKINNSKQALKVAEFLLDNGIDVNERDEDGNISLHNICKMRGINSAPMIISFLLKNGVNINDQNNNGSTPLQMICTMKSDKTAPKLARLLLEKGAKVNQKDGNGNIPIYYSSKLGKKALTEILIDYKANINFIDKDSYVLPTMAYQNKQLEITKLLIDHQSGSSGKRIKSSLLMQAYKRNDSSLIEYIVKNFFTHESVEDQIQLLLSFPSNITDNEKEKDIFYDLKYYVNEIIKSKSIDNHHSKYLLIFSKFDNLKLLTKLLENEKDKINLNIQDENGNTAFHHAILNNNSDMVRLLLENGGDINIRDYNGKTCLYYTQNSHIHFEILNKFLEEHGLITYWKNTDNPTSLVEKIFSKVKTDITDTELNSKLKEELKSSFEKLTHNKALKTILEFAADIQFEMTLWTHSKKDWDGYCNSYINDITIFNVLSKSQSIFADTIIHELTHLVMGKKYSNENNPFYISENSIKIAKFTALAKICLKISPEIFGSLESDLYTEKEYPRELIAYYFGQLAKDVYNDENTIGKSFPIDSDLVHTMWDTLKELNSSLPFNEVLAEVVYVSNSYEGFFENMLGINEAKNIGDTITYDDESWFGMGA